MFAIDGGRNTIISLQAVYIGFFETVRFQHTKHMRIQWSSSGAGQISVESRNETTYDAHLPQQ